MAKVPTPSNESHDESLDASADGPRPTEQLQPESTPMSASNSASGGATGLDHDLAKRPSVFRRHPLSTAIAGGVIAVVLVSGLTAWGVGAAVTASLTSSTAGEMPMAAPTPGATAAPGAGGMSTAGRVAFRATIDSIDGSTWTITTKKGQSVTIAVDGATQFGTKRMSETAGSFAVGDSVVIVAQRTGNSTPTATRIVNAAALGGNSSSGSTGGSSDQGTDGTT